MTAWLSTIPKVKITIGQRHPQKITELYSLTLFNRSICCWHPFCIPVFEFSAQVVYSCMSSHKDLFKAGNWDEECLVWMTFARKQGRCCLAEPWESSTPTCISYTISSRSSSPRLPFWYPGSSPLEPGPAALSWPTFDLRLDIWFLLFGINLCFTPSLSPSLYPDMALVPIFTLPTWMEHQREKNKFAFPGENYLQQGKMKLYTSNWKWGKASLKTS